MENTYNCKQCGKGLLIGQVCTCFLKKACIQRVVETEPEYNALDVLHAEIKALKQENIRLSEQLAFQNKELFAGIAKASSEGIKIQKLESENKKLSEGLTIAYMSGVADGKEGSRVLELENKALKEEREGLYKALNEG